MINQIKLLINELNNASAEYYNTGKSSMSDSDFDIKLNILKKLEQQTGIVLSNSPTQNVGAPIINAINKINISDKPMLSLNKCHTTEEIKNFSKGQQLVASVKCDGLSCRIIYENGEIISANTRGNGVEGGDITEHIKHFINVPLTIPTEKKLIVDGEAIIYQYDFNDINVKDDFKNPRNLAAGTLASLDTSLCTIRRLNFIAWDVIEADFFNNYQYNLQEIKKLGFTIVPNKIAQFNKETINEINEEMKIKAKELGIPCDGVVWRYNDNNFDTSRTAKFFNNAIAYKFYDEEYETTLLDIEWTMGRTGQLTPVAIFEPIKILGSTVSRASLHNISIMKAVLGENPYKGEKIWVIKSNQIIPQITRAEVRE